MSGKSTFDIENLLTECTVPAMQVSVLIIHVGAFDFDPAKENLSLQCIKSIWNVPMVSQVYILTLKSLFQAFSSDKEIMYV